jgi:hypothetical protein
MTPVDWQDVIPLGAGLILLGVLFAFHSGTGTVPYRIAVNLAVIAFILAVCFLAFLI